MLKDVLQQAYDSLKFNRSRTALTMLGMAWGIATVVLLLAYGDGFDRAIHAIFTTFGSKTIQVYGGRTSMQAGGSKAGQACTSNGGCPGGSCPAAAASLQKSRTTDDGVGKCHTPWFSEKYAFSGELYRLA